MKIYPMNVLCSSLCIFCEWDPVPCMHVVRVLPKLQHAIAGHTDAGLARFTSQSGLDWFLNRNPPQNVATDGCGQLTIAVLPGWFAV